MSCYIDPNGTLGWDVLLPYVLPSCRGVPDQIALHEIRVAAIEFCRFTGILHDIQQYYLQAYVGQYQLITDCNYNIHQVFRVLVNQQWEYAPVSKKLPEGRGYYVYHMSSPTIMNLRNPGQIDSPNGLEVETIVIPKQDSCVLDNYLYEIWGNSIAAGALAKLLKLPQTNWYDPKLAADYEMKFRKDKSKCRAQIDRAFSPTSEMQTREWIGRGNRGWGNGYYGGGGCW